MKHSQELGFDDEGRPVLITRAALPYEEEHRQRVRKYLTLMSFRIPALIFAAVAYNIWHNGWISLAIIAVSIAPRTLDPCRTSSWVRVARVTATASATTSWPEDNNAAR